MNGAQGSIDDLPVTYRAIVDELTETNRDLVCRSVSRSRRWPPHLRAYLLFRRIAVNTTVYLTNTGQKVKFFFFRRPRTEEVVLRLDLKFTLEPGLGGSQPHLLPVVAPRVEALMPRFMAKPLPISEMQRLASALGEKQWNQIVFLQAGTFRVGITRVGDPASSHVVWLLHENAVKAETAYIQQPNGSYSVSPLPFLALLDQIRNWLGNDLSSTYATPIVLKADDARPVQRIVYAITSGWNETSKAAQRQKQWSEPIGQWLPSLLIENYNADLVIRLKPNGELAEKRSEDAFRLRLSTTVRVEDGGPVARLTLAPPDFLVSGDLHDQLLENLLQPFAVEKIFKAVQLPKFDRTRFQKFLEQAKLSAMVFRVGKSGDDDVDLFVFRGDWNGAVEPIVVSAAFKVLRNDDGSLRIRVYSDSIEIVYSNLNGGTPEMTVALPQYILNLLNQLRNWQQALQQ